MADDLSKRGPADRSRINTSEDYEMTYWCEKFAVTRAQLQDAIRKVGNSSTAVARELGKDA
jgi:hypothetical protein